MGICPTCHIKKTKPIKQVTYLGDDQVKVVESLCDECIAKSKASKTFIGEGDLTV